MTAQVEKVPDEYVWKEMGTPVCGVDFCDHCGDCLSCYTDDYCPGPDGQHLWVIYLHDDKSPYKQKEK